MSNQIQSLQGVTPLLILNPINHEKAGTQWPYLKLQYQLHLVFVCKTDKAPGLLIKHLQ